MRYKPGSTPRFASLDASAADVFGLVGVVGVAVAAAAEAAAAEEARRTKVDRVVAEAKELLSPEPEKGEAGRVEVMIKTPDGRRLKRAFLGADCVAQIYHFANAEGGEDIAGKDYRFVSTMPRCVYEDREATLEAAGLKGQCALLMEITEEEEEEG
mmetsp:Transcript_69417/g.212790  ORF Transcript_69417/g.212790 Transcript_69417/m.212790 type:complete len:156 (+) Transcript_69417:1647-2114(+)